MWDKDLTWQFELCNAWRLKATKSSMKDCMAETCAVPAASGEKHVILWLSKSKKLIFLFLPLHYLRLARCGAICIFTWLKTLTNQLYVCQRNVLIDYCWEPFVLPLVSYFAFQNEDACILRYWTTSLGYPGHGIFSIWKEKSTCLMLLM